MPDLNQLLTNLDVLLEYAIASGETGEAERIRRRMLELIRLIK